MTIDPETLMAYADGELDPLAAKGVEKAIAADPALAAQVDQHRKLAASLRAAFDPLAAAPVPSAVEAMLRDSARVVFLVPRPARRERSFWMGAVAASLVAGLFTGPLLLPRDPGGVALSSGTAIASGDVAKALGAQLASVQAGDAPVRVGITFRDRAQRWCRTFEAGTTGGIACAQGGDWRIERLYGGVSQQGGAYRQAGSPAAAMMADAQAMMASEPLDAAAERAARDAGWR
ncbi:anti-sigma factor [Sphingomonas sp. BT-65]|uniref:anti-sigma factor family protein n=1 Tax=Sphingomonas sp. BT-65 TaxID=2989821 RepID=UPI0022359D6D|nr:anti-sigma factor [Sphingomonas sp. BT-65]MCW4462709.1 anti-sigma factor [Sphingomonas sp. BT-65]